MGDTCKDITGQKFGMLTVIERMGSDKHGKALWLCECDCPAKTKTIVVGSDLRSGNTKSCGCQTYYFPSGNKFALGNKYNRTHGERHTRLYSIWVNMRTRCYNPKADSYYLYGGRGIQVCQEWRESFESFRNWALRNGYQDNLSIDRKDNDGNYEPGNCRWATWKEQRANQRPRKELNQQCAL